MTSSRSVSRAQIWAAVLRQLWDDFGPHIKSHPFMSAFVALIFAYEVVRHPIRTAKHVSELWRQTG